MLDSKTGWRCFKTNPPYDWTEAVDGNRESDPDVGFILYSYKHDRWGRGLPSPERQFLVGPNPYPFQDGAFTGYRSHMLTSPYPEDHIEVIAWLPLAEAAKILRKSYKGVK
jgi:hypothetical protein